LGSLDPCMELNSYASTTYQYPEGWSLCVYLYLSLTVPVYFVTFRYHSMNTWGWVLHEIPSLHWHYLLYHFQYIKYKNVPSLSPRLSLGSHLCMNTVWLWAYVRYDQSLNDDHWSAASHISFILSFFSISTGVCESLNANSPTDKHILWFLFLPLLFHIYFYAQPTLNTIIIIFVGFYFIYLLLLWGFFVVSSVDVSQRTTVIQFINLKHAFKLLIM